VPSVALKSSTLDSTALRVQEGANLLILEVLSKVAKKYFDARHKEFSRARFNKARQNIEVLEKSAQEYLDIFDLMFLSFVAQIIFSHRLNSKSFRGLLRVVGRSAKETRIRLLTYER
jgi:hypothetical protein